MLRPDKPLALLLSELLLSALLLPLSPDARAGASAPAASGGAAAASGSSIAAPPARWVSVPRITGRLTAADLALVVNSADPYSVAVAAYYAERRGIDPAHVFSVDLPVQATLSPAEFERFNAELQASLAALPGPPIQALALAWREPYAVGCNSITGALALGFQADLCRQTCAASQPSPYASYPGAMPFTDLGMRPAMLLAARSVESARRLIDRGVAADGQSVLEQEGAASPPAQALFVSTADAARNVRARLFPPAGDWPGLGLTVRRVQASGPMSAGDGQRVLIYQTGMARVQGLDQLDWLPGALADHLTSFGGRLDAGEGGQMSVLDWLEAGATASYGTVSEPCNHLQKFPHPQVLLLNYLQGATALEAYWRSVLWPGQGVFVGEPLAAPFAMPAAPPRSP